MATQTSTQMKKFGGGFPGERFSAKLVWDFEVDGGEADDTVRIGYAKTNMIITEAYWHVETACASGGSATMIIGIEGGDTEAFLDVTSGAVASLTDNAVGSETAGQGLYVASGSYVLVDIATADMTAGKVALYVSGYQVA
jgi:hypothetical protein